MNVNRPGTDEYASYYERYIALVPGNGWDTLVAQTKTFPAYLRNIPDHLADYKYAEGKWTVKQVAGHIIDTERIMAYRALRIARNDATELPGFDENSYAENARMDKRTLDDLAGEFEIVRKASMLTFQYLEDDEWRRKGIASGNPVSVRALLYIITGHLQHHLAVYGERYFLGERSSRFLL